MQIIWDPQPHLVSQLCSLLHFQDQRCQSDIARNRELEQDLFHYRVNWTDVWQFVETYVIISYGWRKDVVNNCLEFVSGKVKLKERENKTKQKPIVFGGLNPSVRDSSLNELQQQHKFFGRKMVNHYPTNHYPTNHYPLTTISITTIPRGCCLVLQRWNGQPVQANQKKKRSVFVVVFCCFCLFVCLLLLLFWGVFVCLLLFSKKGVNQSSKDVTGTQQQRLESPTVILTRRASKQKVYTNSAKGTSCFQTKGRCRTHGNCQQPRRTVYMLLAATRDSLYIVSSHEGQSIYYYQVRGTVYILLAATEDSLYNLLLAATKDSLYIISSHKGQFVYISSHEGQSIYYYQPRGTVYILQVATKDSLYIISSHEGQSIYYQEPRRTVYIIYYQQPRKTIYILLVATKDSLYIISSHEGQSIYYQQPRRTVYIIYCQQPRKTVHILFYLRLQVGPNLKKKKTKGYDPLSSFVACSFVT